MREFCTKYNGNVQQALRGVQKERLAALGEDVGGEMDRTARKRKWVEEQAASSSKNARLVSPVKKPQRPKAGATPGKLPFRRPTTSPAKPSTATNPSRSRVPSTSTFNPVLPPKTPGYPRAQPATSTYRLPRKDENVVMSVNGSPLANPFWDDPNPNPGGGRPLKRTNSSISIRRDPSFNHSRSTSQTSLFGGGSSRSQSTNSNHTHVHHSRSNSEATLASPTDHQFQFPPKDKDVESSENETPLPKSRMLGKSKSTYTVTLSTHDGHLLEFDPLLTSPGELDKLEGISDEAKKQAKEEMGKLVRAAMEKWKIG
ncbi:hypothetical protein VKT23_003637 [Stygiomarasmius scandens]|uniref:Borealin N-terminal domain-containing protein n=1 Tax=Marasmiellus scandens TaxID=2682957 RepID=A0ABR1K055_9AGAR